MGIFGKWFKKDQEKKVKKAAPKTRSVETPKAEKEVTENSAQVKSEKIAPLGGSVSSRVLMYPLVTEKSAVSESNNKYIFVVASGADKNQVKEAVREAYGIKPVSVNIINIQGKTVRQGRASGRRGDFKKAIVTLQKGKTIAVHEGV